MPHPGLKVATNPKFDGRLCGIYLNNKYRHNGSFKYKILLSIFSVLFVSYFLDIEDEFKNCLRTLVPLLLSPENLVQKEIGGQKVKVKELVQYFKCYMNLFSGDDLPEPKSMLVVSIY